MNKQIFLLIFAILSIACKHKQEKNIKQKTIIEKEVFKPYKLSIIPNNWTKLIKKETKFIIFNSCSGGNKRIKITSKDKQLLFHGQQEDTQFTILSSEISNLEKIRLKAQMDNSIIETFKIEWVNKSTGLAKWHNTSNTNTFEYFTSNNFKSKYETIEEPCIECWGEDECNEMEKNL